MQVLLWLSLLAWFIYTHGTFNVTDHTYPNKPCQVLISWCVLSSDAPACLSYGGPSRQHCNMELGTVNQPSG